MTVPPDAPMASLGELAAHHGALTGRDMPDLDRQIDRMSLKDIAVGYAKLKLAGFGARAVETIEARPVQAILITFAVGLIGGRLLRR